MLYVNRSTIIAIILLILRSFQRKGLCNSGLKAKSTTFVRNITTIRLRSQFVISKNKDSNMADITEKTGNGELVTNRDQLVGVDNIEPLIKIIRGQQVMLDRVLATLYGVETKRLNEQVKRNIKRFPEDFMFQLTKDECLRSQIATLNEGRGQHLKYMPYVFTENGVAMLSSVLRSDTAIEVNIRIMRAFTSMRHFLQNNAEVFQRLFLLEYHQLEMQHIYF